MSNKNPIRRYVKKHLGGALQVLMVLVALIAVSAFQSRNMLSTSDSLAPPLVAPLLQGGTYDLAQSSDRPVLVYFFAPWCTYCKFSSDNLRRLRRLRSEDSLEIVAVALSWQDREEVVDYVERHDLDLPVLLGGREAANDWSVYAFPSYYVLDSEHRIRRRDLGYSTQLGLWWRTWMVD